MALINFEEDKIILEKCKNKHKIVFNNLKEFMYSQDTREDKCFNCNKIYGNYNRICPLCKVEKPKREVQNFFNCKEHNRNFTTYCQVCNLNLCPTDEAVHVRHKKTYLKQIIPGKPKIDEIKKNIREFQGILLAYKKTLENSKDYFLRLFETLIDNVKEYDYLNEYIMNCIENLNSYETIYNMTSIDIKKFSKELNQFLKEDILNKVKFLINEYNTIPKKELIAEYKANEQNIRIFGERFVKNNKDNCYLIIENKPYELQEYYPIPSDKKIINVKLITKKKLSDISYMFSGCKSLLDLMNISKFETEFTNMSHTFYECESLYEIPDLSNWNTMNVSNMDYIFNGCKSLELLPNISTWNTKNVIKMNNMFSDCASLRAIPDISKWNTENVTDMSKIFSGCKSLESLPDISKWNTSLNTDMNNMFSGCFKLLSLPNISKWNTENVKNMNQIFLSCVSLAYLPDISIWKTDKVLYMKEMFSGCAKLRNLPDISKWKTDNVQDMREMFSFCRALYAVPDISDWDVKNVNAMKGMFSYCNSLCKVPELTRWKTKKGIDMRYMFSGCKKDLKIPFNT